MVEVAVTIVCGVDAQSFSTKMIFSTSVGSKGGGGGENHAAPLGQSSPGREKTQYTRDCRQEYSGYIHVRAGRARAWVWHGVEAGT